MVCAAQRLLAVDEDICGAAHPRADALIVAIVWVCHNRQVLQGLLKLWQLQQQQQQQQSYTAAVQQLVSDLGPLWVKLGQTLAVRPDVVGPQLASALSTLQETAPPFPTATAAAIVEEELGAAPAQLFESWSEVPVASASLGQVYKAVLRVDGRRVKVAVKVR